jgi:hypothetical protein
LIDDFYQKGGDHLLTTQHDTPKYHIQPYHMNGLNWRLVPDDPGRDNIVIVTGFMPSWWTEEYGITFGADFHLDLDVHRAGSYGATLWRRLDPGAV